MFRRFRERRKRKRLATELSQSLARIRGLAESGVCELELCSALLSLQDEQLEAAVAIGDEVTARELMEQMPALLKEREKLIARETEFNEQILAIVIAIEEKKNG